MARGVHGARPERPLHRFSEPPAEKRSGFPALRRVQCRNTPFRRSPPTRPRPPPTDRGRADAVVEDPAVGFDSSIHGTRMQDGNPGARVAARSVVMPKAAIIRGDRGSSIFSLDAEHHDGIQATEDRVQVMRDPDEPLRPGSRSAIRQETRLRPLPRSSLRRSRRWMLERATRLAMSPTMPIRRPARPPRPLRACWRRETPASDARHDHHPR